MRVVCLVSMLMAGCGLILDVDQRPADAADSGSSDATGTMDATPGDGDVVDALDDARGPDGSSGDAGADAFAVDGSVGPACDRMTVPASSDTLLTTDVLAIQLCGAPSLAAQGFRCKSYTFCTDEQACYYSDDLEQLGHYQSSDGYYDGPPRPFSEPLSFRMDVGADSRCGNPVVDIGPGEFVRVTLADGRQVDVDLPEGSFDRFRIYVVRDGSTFWNAARTMPTR